MGQTESAPAPTATEARPRPTPARPTSYRQDSGSYAPLSTSYPPENEPVPEPWPLGLFSSLSLRPSNPPPPSAQNPKPPSSTSLPSSSLGSSSLSSSSSTSSNTFFPPPPSSSSTSALSSSSTSSTPSTSSSYPSQPPRQRRRNRRASTSQVLSQPPAPSSWRRIGRDDDLSEDEEVSDEDDEISRGDNRNAPQPQPYRGTGSLILPGPPGPPSASYSKGKAQPPSQPVRGGPPPSTAPYPGYPAGRGYAQAVGTPSRGSQPPNRIQMSIRPGAPARGSAAQRNVVQSRAVTEQQQALQAMGIPLEMVDQLLSGDGDLDEEAFNRLVLLTTALQPQQDKGVPPHILDSLPQITYCSASIVEVSEKSCVVCLEDFEEQETLIKLPQCIHAFHRQCIRSWLVEKASCPVCRTPVE